MDEAGGVLVVRFRSASVDSRIVRRDERGLATMVAIWAEDNLPEQNRQSRLITICYGNLGYLELAVGFWLTTRLSMDLHAPTLVSCLPLLDEK